MPPPSHHPSAVRHQTSRAFTLIELLVVISIIALLIALLLPSLGLAKEVARTTVCGSNLKQIGSMFHLYGSDNRGYLPHLGVVYTAPASPHVGEWYLFYYPYLMSTKLPSRHPLDVGANNRVFDCPSIPDDTIYRFDYLLGYAYIEPGSRINHGLNGKKLEDLRSDTILVIDRHQDYPVWNYMSSPLNEEGRLYIAFYTGTGSAPYLPGFHHNMGASILFPGGHVRWHKRADYQPLWESSAFWMKEYISQ